MSMVDMEELKKFNPKLHEQISENPERLLELQDVILSSKAHENVEMAAQAMQLAAENLQYKPPKVYSLPFIWAYFAPIFTFTAVSSFISLYLKGGSDQTPGSYGDSLVSIHHCMWFWSPFDPRSSNDQANGPHQQDGIGIPKHKAGHQPV